MLFEISGCHRHGVLPTNGRYRNPQWGPGGRDEKAPPTQHVQDAVRMPSAQHFPISHWCGGVSNVFGCSAVPVASYCLDYFLLTLNR